MMPYVDFLQAAVDGELIRNADSWSVYRQAANSLFDEHAAFSVVPKFLTDGTTLLHRISRT